MREPGGGWSRREAGLTGEGRRVGVGVDAGGAGIYKSADGDVFEGEYENDKKNGRGGRGVLN